MARIIMNIFNEQLYIYIHVYIKLVSGTNTDSFIGTLNLLFFLYEI